MRVRYASPVKPDAAYSVGEPELRFEACRMYLRRITSSRSAAVKLIPEQEERNLVQFLSSIPVPENSKESAGGLCIACERPLPTSYAYPFVS